MENDGNPTGNLPVDQDSSLEDNLIVDEEQDFPDPVLEDFVEPLPEEEEAPEDKPEFVPKARLNEVISQRQTAEDAVVSERTARLEAERKLEELAPKVPPITRERLRTAIEQGVISQEQADLTWDEVLVERAAAKSAEAQRVASERAHALDTTNAEINRFRAAIPSIEDLKTSDRQAVERAYADVVSRYGTPKKDDTVTILKHQLTALRETFGRIEDVEKVKKGPATRTRMPIREVGGLRPNINKSVDPVSKLSNVQRRFYAKMIERGVYKEGWKSVREELTWERKKK